MDVMNLIRKEANANLDLQNAEKMLQHVEAINAIMIDMMPGLLQMCCQRFTADMVKIYFRTVRVE